MGQAKLRGSFEQRKHDAIIKQKNKQLEEKLKEEEYFNSLTDIEKKNYIIKKKNAQHFITTAYSIVNSLTIPY
jgi:hypothetical protein